MPGSICCSPSPNEFALRRVTKVREFQRVAKLCEADGHMQQKLKQLLKLSKEKWDAACEHAKTAVQVALPGLKCDFCSPSYPVYPSCLPLLKTFLC